MSYCFFEDKKSIKTKNHFVELPLTYQSNDSQKISIFVREIWDSRQQNQPTLIFLQGGPGFPSGRFPSFSGWLSVALKHFKVLLLDQRGTGLSQKLTIDRILDIDEAKRAEYLSYFRAPFIIKDVIELEKYFLQDSETWTVLGQSFGGFCLANYLSQKPNRIKEGIFTGGIPPLKNIDDVYENTFKTLQDKNNKFYKNFPKSFEMVEAISEYLKNNKVILPNGDILTIKRFRQIGIKLGGLSGSHFIYHTLETGFYDLKQFGKFSYDFLLNFVDPLGILTNPIYALLHEPCYADGYSTKWSAQKNLDSIKEFQDTSNNHYFYGEMIFPWVFDEYRALAPLKKLANELAQKDDWEKLYDKKLLTKIKTPLVAAIYENDMYVEKELSLEFSNQFNNIDLWITSEFEHNGLTNNSDAVLSKLFSMLGY